MARVTQTAQVIFSIESAIHLGNDVVDIDTRHHFTRPGVDPKGIDAHWIARQDLSAQSPPPCAIATLMRGRPFITLPAIDRARMVRAGLQVRAAGNHAGP